MTNVTLRDVAERAGVSMSTVSRVLGGTYPTARATQTKVMRAAEELNYVAHAQARALAGGGSRAIAILISSVTSEFHTHVVKGIDEQVTEEGRFSLIGITWSDPDREAALIRMMREQRASAVFLVGGVVTDEHYETRMSQCAHSLASSGSRLVLVGRPPLAAPDVPATTVAYDNVGGAYAATSHLLSQGHRRILYLGRSTGHTTFEARVEGYVSALDDYGVDYDEALVVTNTDDWLSAAGWPARRTGYRMLSERLAVGPADFTAVFAADDEIAAGALQALRALGLKVPDDMSLVGYNDMPVASDFGLTTVHLPHEELGRVAARLALHEADERGHGPAAIHRVLGTHLVIRDSVRPLTARS